jgi:hypothetical protein
MEGVNNGSLGDSSGWVFIAGAAISQLAKIARHLEELAEGVDDDPDRLERVAAKVAVIVQESVIAELDARARRRTLS